MSAFDNFVNNPTYYDLVSGWVPAIAIAIGLPAFILKHNCYEHGCKRPARVVGDDSHRRCKRCHKRTHPDYDARHWRVRARENS